jgi:predicted aldo/keto reductase-like oxidoreductase
MEPLLGGKLANPPGSIGEMFRQNGKQRSPADWALQWVWNHPQVSMVLSGMTTLQQVKENLRSADVSGADTFDSEELYFINQIRGQFESRAVIPCTRCGYCIPCPNGVNIPRNFEIYNNGIMFDDMQSAEMFYSRFLPADERAGQCLECTVCESLCPQGIPISEWMLTVHDSLGNKA